MSYKPLEDIQGVPKAISNYYYWTSKLRNIFLQL